MRNPGRFEALMPVGSGMTELPSPRVVTIEELPVFAAEFASGLKPGDRVCLSGNLGSGKTTFLFHVTRALKIASDAGFSSPTFAILNRYETPAYAVLHADLYRLSTYEEFESLDLVPTLAEPEAVTFIEWGDKFPELADFYTIKMRFEAVAGNAEARLITWERA